MRTKRHTNLLWGLVLLAASLVLVLNAFEVIPQGVYDLIARGWPALLVLAGLFIFLRDRIRFGGIIALAGTAALVAGVVTLAFSARSAEFRESNQYATEQAVSEEILLLQVNVESLATDVRFEAAPERTVSAEFIGSDESTVTSDYAVDEDDPTRATFTLRETQAREFPLLENVGRGRLVVQLPPELPVAVAFEGQNGEATFDMGELSLERLSAEIGHGDVLLTLPVYNPLSPNAREQPSVLTARDGDATIVVPDEVAARIELNRGGSGIQPEYDPDKYNLLVGDVLESRDFDDAEITVHYIVTAPRGLVRLEVPEAENTVSP